MWLWSLPRAAAASHRERCDNTSGYLVVDAYSRYTACSMSRRGQRLATRIPPNFHESLPDAPIAQKAIDIYSSSIASSTRRRRRTCPRVGEDALARWIDGRGPERADVAARVGITRGTMNLLCRDARKPSLELAFAIERLTRVRITARSWLRVPPHVTGDRKRTRHVK